MKEEKTQGIEKSHDTRFNKRYSSLTRRIVAALAKNSRYPVVDIAKDFGISRREAARRVREIEAALALDYTLEMKGSRMGFSNSHLIAVKFRARPDYDDIKTALEESYIPQLAFTTKGMYDMVIFANPKSAREYAVWDRHMRRRLAKYGIEWQPSEIAFKRIGFFPFDDRLIAEAKVPETDRKILAILNKDSRISLKELAAQLGMGYKTAVYNFNRVAAAGYIKRFTALIRPDFRPSLICVFTRYEPATEGERASFVSRKVFTDDDEDPLISRYLLKISLIGSFDSFSMSAFDSFRAGYRHSVQQYKRAFGRLGSMKVRYAEVDKVLIGRLPIRNIPLEEEFKEHISKDR